MRSNAVFALIEAAATVIGAAVDWPRLVSGAREALPSLLRTHRRLPLPFVEAALALGDPELLVALAHNSELLAAHPALRERAARGGRPGITTQALLRWDLRHQRLALTHHPADGPDVTPWINRQRSGVVGPTAAAVRSAWLGNPAGLTVAEHWRALATLARVEPDGAGLPEATLHPEVRAHLPLSAAQLEAKAAEWEGTTGAIDELRRGFAEHLPLRTELDWAAIAAAHDETPFAGAAAAGLAARADCPPALRAALYAADPAAVAPVLPRFTQTEALAAVPKKAARAVARRAVAERLDPALLLRRLQPAAAVLEWVRLDDLADLVRRHLGADPAKWAWVRAKLNAFPGPVTELLESAGTAAWPARVATGRTAFVTLLDHAPAAAHLALLDDLDEKTIAELFARGTWRPEWLDRAVADPRPEIRLALAARPSLDAASAERLATLDDPRVNGLVFRRTGTSYRLRMELLAGRPLDPEVRTQLLQQTAGWHGTDALDCADVQLQRHILRHVRIRGKTAQLRLLLNLWHRHGAAAVADLLAAELKGANFSAAVITPAVRRRVEAILAVTDPAERAAQLGALEAETAAEESPEGQFALLRAERTDHTNLFKETRLWHWDAIVAEHRREPLPDPILAVIATGREVPVELVEAGRTKLRPWDSEQAAEHAAGRSVEAIVGTVREGVQYGGWITAFIAAGVATWPQLLRHAVPAGLVLEHIGGSAGHPEGRAALAALLAEGWDGDLDAIALAAGLVSDYPGPVAELVTVAAATVSV
ncbi:hypothetical protein Dvina_26635 [Dactylosporangium vinaceum]|uniref:Secreted protein n=1 Tax=Dactylosporangium vinaceum TaxID=53362 RepID=A0ABV5M5P1_9ACTN|nr:hypothetical protein [Dactylosporangium vinaceum]UAC01297.1 hypothetical protein Dvina_26635 [Dactylosporangium vinaceum]